MNVKQNLAILFYLKRSKIDKAGKIPVYVRLTIDGLKVDMSLGIKVLGDHWDMETKTVKPAEPKHKSFNKKIAQVKTDLERHFDLMQAKYQVATPQLVLNSYKTPLNGERIRQEKIDNLSLSEQIDDCINRYLLYYDKYCNANKYGRTLPPVKQYLLEQEKWRLDRDIEILSRKATEIFEQKERSKTLIMAVDEHLLNFLQLATVGHRSPNTLEKLTGRKRRFLEFLDHRSLVSG